ncbi:MAG TPA: hypothetical protein VIJ94_05125 [Caulobacteraceae bacterium]
MKPFNRMTWRPEVSRLPRHLDVSEASERIPPGPPSVIKREGGARLLAACAGVLVILLVKNFVFSIDINGNTLPDWMYRIISYQFLTNDGIAAILAATIGGYYVYRQLIFQLRPHLTFTGKIQQGSDFVDSSSGRKFWTVEVANYGNGPALLEAVTYKLKMRKYGTATGSLRFEQIRAFICEDLEEFREFLLYRYSKGAICPAGRPMTLFQCEHTYMTGTIEVLDVVFWYRGFGGGIYAKRVVCIPEYWEKMPG